MALLPYFLITLIKIGKHSELIFLFQFIFDINMFTNVVQVELLLCYVKKDAFMEKL